MGQPTEQEVDTTPAEGVSYTRPASDLDLEARLKDDYTSSLAIGTAKNPGDNEVLDSDGFVGVSPEYQNYANDTDKPLDSGEGAEADAAEAVADSLDKGSTPAGATHLTGGALGASTTSPAPTVQQNAANQPNPAQVPGQ